MGSVLALMVVAAEAWASDAGARATGPETPDSQEQLRALVEQQQQIIERHERQQEAQQREIDALKRQIEALLLRTSSEARKESNGEAPEGSQGPALTLGG